MTTEFNALQETLGYRFKNQDLLRLAMTHSSYANENAENKKSTRDHTTCNERLEFLGDAILQIVSSDFLYARYQNVPEGDLSPLRTLLVREDACCEYGKRLGINRCLLLGRGERKGGGSEKSAIVADAFEALLAAVYLDAGEIDAMPLLKKLVVPFLEKKLNFIMMEPEVNANYKQTLQEFLAQGKESVPVYKTVGENGPDHEKTFTVAVYLDNNELGRGEGKKKKDAEQAAAKEALRILGQME